MTLPVRRVVGVLALALALVTAGCGSLETNRAATVDGRVISETEVQSVMSEFNGMSQPRLDPLTPATTLSLLLQARPALQFFDEHGVVASDSVAEQDAQSRGVADPSPATIEALRFLDSLQQASDSGKFTQADQQELVQKIASQKVEVNPRYGTFDPTNISVQATQPDWITPAS
ncbi:hypothetical protein [Phycicoccus flavus]|uniref:hypothetical protein n=1 Tax=Phycicoccus flavus TaxID=2502783 RepID=UPI000FEC180B|nr:hypothetical protein [Phycicoccus flavus]NHA67576.1 hypothetical protein [Phycicoccus flavus]